MDNYSYVEINGRGYKETYHQGLYTLYRNGEAVAMVTSIGGLYVKGNKEDIKIWFSSLGVKENS